MAKPSGEARLLDRLNEIEVDGCLVLQALLDANTYLARRPVDRGGDRRHHHRVEQTNHVLTTEHQHGSSLIRGLERVGPNLAAADHSGHTLSSGQPFKSRSIPARFPPYARLYASAMLFTRRRRRYSAAA